MTGATVVITGTFADGYEAHFAEYSKRVRDFLSKHGGTVVRRQRVSKLLEGEPADLVMLIDFPSAEVASTIFGSPEYQAILPLRARVFRRFTMLLAAAGEV